MLKVIIADDELTTRESLKEYICWDAFGAGDVRTAKDGFEALELAKATAPDILITDVRMPRMDGIVLASKIRELCPDCRIIFISGYSDKEYLKSAIHLKAVSYIEKPIDLEEVENVVSQAASACMEDNLSREKAEQLRTSVTQSRPYIRQEAALDLIRGNTTGISLLKKLNDPVAEALTADSFNTLCININWEPSINDKRRDETRRKLTGTFCDGKLFDQKAVIAAFTHDDTIVLIISGPLSKNLGSSAFPGSILEKLNEISEGVYTASVGTGTQVNRVSDLPLSYSNAVIAANMQFYSGSGRVYSYSRCGTHKYIPDKKLLRRFRELLRKDDKEGAVRLVKNLTHNIRTSLDPEIDRIKNIYFSLLLQVYEAAWERQLIEPVDDTDRSYIWQEINAIRSLSECSDYIESNISGIFNKFGNSDIINRKTYEIKKYIKENYSSKDLTIQAIAGHIHFSQTYLCSFLKKSTGCTLNEYITDVRIEKAKELLQDNSIKLYEVAVSIGFTDSNYFSTLFKKVTGFSPSEYRDKYRL